MPDGLFVGRLEIVDVQHFAGSSGLPCAPGSPCSATRPFAAAIKGCVIPLSRSNTGTFGTDGSLSIPNVRFKVHESRLEIGVGESQVTGDSQVTLTLTTGTSSTSPLTVTGTPADAAGNIVIVGSGTIDGDPFDGTAIAATLTGVLTPRP